MKSAVADFPPSSLEAKVQDRILFDTLAFALIIMGDGEHGPPLIPDCDHEVEEADPSGGVRYLCGPNRDLSLLHVRDGSGSKTWKFRIEGTAPPKELRTKWHDQNLPPGGAPHIRLSQSCRSRLEKEAASLPMPEPAPAPMPEPAPKTKPDKTSKKPGKPARSSRTTKN